MQKVKLNDIAEFIKTGKTPPTSQTQYFDGQVNWYTPGDFNNGKKLNTSKRTLTQIALDDKKAITFPKDTLLITCIGDIGKIGITQEDCSSNQQITGIKPKENTDVNYLYYWFIANKKVLENTANSAVVPILNNKTLQNIDFKFPSLPTQQKIAEILDTADQFRQYNKQLIAKYDALTQSLFLEMFGDPVRNEKRWEKMELKKMGKVITGSTPPSSKNNMFGGEIPFVTPGDLDKSAPYKRFVTEEGALNSRTVNKGALFVCCIGATIGKSGIARELSTFNQQINAVEWNSNISSQFGFNCFSFIKKELIEKAISTTLPIMKKSEFEKLKMICPPLSLQTQFAERVQMIETQKQQAQEALSKSEDLFQSLLQKAFKGELN